MHLVDVHTHILNARHVPVRGFLKGCFHLPEPLLQSLARMLPLLTEARLPVTLEPGAALDDVAQEWALILAAGDSHQGREAVRALRVASELADQPHFRLHPHLQAGLPSIHGGILHHLWVEALQGAIAWLLQEVDSLLREQGLGEGARLLFHLVQDEGRLARRLCEEYRDLDPSWGVDRVRFAFQMLDLEMGCGEASLYPYPEQIARLRRVLAVHGEDALGFVAFDPRRMDGLSLVKSALMRGFTGIRLDPVPGGHGSLWNLRLEDLFAFAEEARIPIVTPCAPAGWVAEEEGAWACHPDQWEGVLRRFPALVLCLAQAGGGDHTLGGIRSAGWCPEDEAAWASEANLARGVVELCRRHPHVYCDVSGHRYLLGRGPEAALLRQRFEARFLLEMRRPAAKDGGSFPFASKLLYGSGWPLGGQAAWTRDYLGYWCGLFLREGLSLEGFLHRNAEAFLAPAPVPSWV